MRSGVTICNNFKWQWKMMWPVSASLQQLQSKMPLLFIMTISLGHLRTLSYCNKWHMDVLLN